MVNVFVPVADVRESCEMLDGVRLGKQRSEIKIILAALTGVRFKAWKGEYALDLPERRGYTNHAVTRAWRGYERALADFGRINCEVWAEKYGHEVVEGAKGYDTWLDMVNWISWLDKQDANRAMPDWWGREDVHSSHRQVLLSKDYDYYRQFGWDESPLYEYVWPV